MTDPNGNLIIYGQDYYIDQRKAAFYGKEFGLEHAEPVFGQRLSYWSAAATDRQLKWIGSKADFVGRWGPTPGKHIDALGKGLVVGFTFAAAGEVYALGAETISMAPSLGPGAPIAVGIGLFEIAVAIGLTVATFNTAAAP